ncbi:MAG: lysine--tRNA ligase [Planctomycetota bacterium]|jgi:lysyl-tRNA synthetase class 2
MSDERSERIKKLDVLRGLGVDPFGKRFDGARAIGSITAGCGPDTEGKDFTVAGRLTALRGHGKAAFADLRDQTGKVQLHFRKDEVGDEAFKVFKNIGIGDLVGATGRLGKTRTGEITIFVKTFTLLTKALRPLPEKWHGLKDPETRYRQRYLDLLANPDVRDTFLKRTKIISLTRKFLDDRGYVEVETPVLCAHAGGAAARPFATHHNALDRDMLLRISLEVPLKKLMVGGIDKVYELGRVFRNEGIDATHNPEFTMLELYHAYGDLRTIMDLMEAMIPHLAREMCGATKIPWGDAAVNTEPPWPRKEFSDLVREHAGIDPDDQDAVRAKMKETGRDPAGLTHAEMLDYVFGDFAEPKLLDAVFVTGQPVELTPLCREIPGRPGRADRFELYLAGMEIANAYTELNDPLEQHKRLKQQAGGIDDDFVHALEHGMPPAGGLGVGVDRVVRILTNQKNMREIILFPTLREVNPAGGPSAEEESGN